ncbi:hypothetical protein LCGC14_2445840 [marine sediment metagenome]|uniref:Uncharacterized protein n=1 Tax=marine sediment metagenome TaxID=412755 RepID=A0A0F9EBF9_9ZZZZ
MNNLEVVGALMLYAKFPPAAGGVEAVKQAVIQAEAEGNVVVDIIPIYEGAYMMGATAVYLKVAGSTRNVG